MSSSKCHKNIFVPKFVFGFVVALFIIYMLKGIKGKNQYAGHPKIPYSHQKLFMWSLMENIRKLVIIVFFVLWGSGFAQAQDRAIEDSSNTISINENASSKERYAIDCKQYQLECHISYGKGEVEPERKRETQAPTQTYSGSSSEPLVIGPTAIIIVLVLIVGGIILLMRFGGSGVLLSAAPKEIKASTEVPENWDKSNNLATRKSDDILSNILAIEDRREALIELLRMCLLHGANISSTRLARSDTERTVIRRLPKELPQRSELEVLLKTTELVHYGGQDISNDQFNLLIDKARNFLNIRKMANA